MKRLVKLNLVVTVAAITVSCKKSYACICEVVSTPQGGSGQFYVKAYKKSEAEKECSSHSSYVTNSTPPTYDTYCSIK